MEKREQNKLCHLFMGDLGIEQERERDRERQQANVIMHNSVIINSTSIFRKVCINSELTGSFPVLYLSVRRRSSTLECVSSVHRGVTPWDILVCVIRKMQMVMNTIAELLPGHVHAHKRKKWFGMTGFQQMLSVRE